MNITFVSRRYELRDSQKSFIQDKIRGMRERYFERRIDVQVKLTSQKYRQRCELRVSSDGFQELVKSETHDMQQSIVEALDKLELMLRKLHDKRVNKKYVEKRAASGPAVELPLEDSLDEDDAEDAPEIVEV